MKNHRVASGRSNHQSVLPAASRLDQIRDRGFIRVGYFTETLPYAYFNDDGDLVGLDVEMAHLLARELEVDLELVPVDRDPETLERQLDGRYCDIVMSGVAVTTERARAMVFSAPYLDETLAFVVRDDLRDNFTSIERVARLENIRIGVPPLNFLQNGAREAFPNAIIETPAIAREASTRASTSGLPPSVAIDKAKDSSSRSINWTRRSRMPMRSCSGSCCD